MGVEHGGDRGTSPPRIWSGGKLMQTVPQILSCRYKNERSEAFKIRQNPFSAGALPRTPLGELTTLPRPLSRLERDTSPHTPPHSARIHLRRAPCVPQKSSQIYAYDRAKYHQIHCCQVQLYSWVWVTVCRVRWTVITEYIARLLITAVPGLSLRLRYSHELTSAVDLAADFEPLQSLTFVYAGWVYGDELLQQSRIESSIKSLHLLQQQYRPYH